MFLIANDFLSQVLSLGECLNQRSRLRFHSGNASSARLARKVVQKTRSSTKIPVLFESVRDVNYAIARVPVIEKRSRVLANF